MDAAVKAAKKEGAAAGRKDVMRALHQLHRRPAVCRRHCGAQGERMLWACDAPHAPSLTLITNCEQSLNNLTTI